VNNGPSSFTIVFGNGWPRILFSIELDITSFRLLFYYFLYWHIYIYYTVWTILYSSAR